MAKATAVLAVILLAAQLTTAAASAELWQDRLLVVPYQREAPPDRILLELVRQDYEALEVNRSIDLPQKRSSDLIVYRKRRN